MRLWALSFGSCYCAFSRYCYSKCIIALSIFCPKKFQELTGSCIFMTHHNDIRSLHGYIRTGGMQRRAIKISSPILVKLIKVINRCTLIDIESVKNVNHALNAQSMPWTLSEVLITARRFRPEIHSHLSFVLLTPKDEIFRNTPRSIIFITIQIKHFVILME